MANIPLIVIASLSGSLATSDNYSPSLEALLHLQVLKARSPELVASNPIPEQIESAAEYVQIYMPIQYSIIAHEKVAHISDPFYILDYEDIHKVRRRWDYQEKCLDWGKKMAKFSTSEGHTKSYDIPLFVRGVKAIYWYVMGDESQILKYLQSITHLGKKRAYGYGHVVNWNIYSVQEDYSLINEDKLVKSIPLACAKELLSEETVANISIAKHGWKPPAWYAPNKVVCAMSENIRYGTELLPL